MARYGKRKGKKKKMHKRNNHNKASYSISRSLITADRKFVTLRYNDLRNLSGIVTNYDYRANSLYDPDSTGVGAQPLGFDQLAALYTRYRVHGCRISVQSVNEGVSANVVVVAPADTSTTISGIAQAIEAPYACWRLLPANQRYPTKLSCYLSTKKKFGLKAIDNAEDLASLTTTNPSEQWFFTLITGDVGGIQDNITRHVVTLEYFCEFFDRRDLTRS